MKNESSYLVKILIVVVVVIVLAVVLGKFLARSDITDGDWVPARLDSNRNWVVDTSRGYPNLTLTEGKLFTLRPQEGFMVAGEYKAFRNYIEFNFTKGQIAGGNPQSFGYEGGVILTPYGIPLMRKP